MLTKDEQDEYAKAFGAEPQDATHRRAGLATWHLLSR